MVGEQMARTKKYTYDDRKRIAARIQNITNQEDCCEIYEIISSDDDSVFTQSSSGVHIDMTRLSDSLLAKLEAKMREFGKRKKDSDEEIDNDVIPISVVSRPKRAHKRSIYEESILKQRRLKSATE
jgi:hypothetical protein